MSELLLEIGLEEVPAGFMPDTLKQLEEHAQQGLLDQRLAFEDLKVLGTPRRLVLKVQGLSERQNDLSEEVRGPSLKVAYQEDGTPGKALMGFMRSQGCTLEDLEDRDGYVYAHKTEAGRHVVAVLTEWLPALILGLHFPKMMRWGSWKTRYVRPIHWIVALLDDEVIPFSLEMVKSDRKSRGHRHLGEAEFAIASAYTYEEQLENNFVIADPARRKEMILSQMAALAEQANGVIEKDEALLEEVLYLVEYPQALMGVFDTSFLHMPDELIITPMKEHQRYFPVRSKADGKLLNRFVTVRNGTAEHIEVVQAGNERVLTARLSDARFFYDEDLKVDPERWLEKLHHVVFQEKLGTVAEKVQRTEALAGQIAKLINADENDMVTAQRAAHLSKADLMSNVVTEFPELQGLIGEVYMAHAYPKEVGVAQAVREHYMPRFAGDAVPTSVAGTIVAMADKTDTIVGCFAAGIEPTGSQDPYGLRRQATGIVSMLVKNQLHLSLKALLDMAIAELPNDLVTDVSALRDKVYDFFRQRLRTLLRDTGYSATFTEAVLNAGYDDVSALVQRSNDIHHYIEHQGHDFENILTVFKRAHNLVMKSQGVAVDASLFEAEAEHHLYRAIKKEDAQSIHEKLDAVRALYDPVNRFFDDVMIMDEREHIRENHLALLRLFTDLTDDIIDLSAL